MVPLRSVAILQSSRCLVIALPRRSHNVQKNVKRQGERSTIAINAVASPRQPRAIVERTPLNTYGNTPYKRRRHAIKRSSNATWDRT